MDIFLLLFNNLIPLYVLIAIGWIAGRYLDVDRQSLGSFAIYIIMPIVTFGFMLNLEWQTKYLILPVIVFFLMSAMHFFWLAVGQKIFGDSRANLLGLTCVSGNTGYMGLPIILALFEPQWVAIYILMMAGSVMCEGTTGYYVAARSSFTIRDSLIKLARFPVVYAVVFGLIGNLFDFKMSVQVEQYWGYFKGVYVIVGMMIIGAALSKIDKLVFGPRFVALSFLGQFVLWPLVAFLVTRFDVFVTQLFDTQVHNLLLVMSLMPPAANIAAFALQLNLRPEKAATTILVGTLLALIYIPFMLIVLGIY